jgi:hypothetical protein
MKSDTPRPFIDAVDAEFTEVDNEKPSAPPPLHATRTNLIPSPGRFEGEPTYVPYFWNSFLRAERGEGGRSRGAFVTFDVRPADRLRFPALEYASRVILWQNDDGLVRSSREDVPERALIERDRWLAQFERDRLLYGCTDKPSHPVWRWALKWLLVPIIWAYVGAWIFVVGALAMFVAIVLVLMTLGIMPPSSLD